RFTIAATACRRPASFRNLDADPEDDLTRHISRGRRLGLIERYIGSLDKLVYRLVEPRIVWTIDWSVTKRCVNG
ncbi:hypothetical protein, partial [Ensifer aridi]|uniref:hypothetical protein n=1 Tax=Ensifer aridi TaxID=1708715 RepID=UPI0015E481DE